MTGPVGPPGLQGPKGEAGIQGPPGQNGRRRESGTSGIPGTPGGMSYKNWKECVWKDLNNNRDKGLIKVGYLRMTRLLLLKQALVLLFCSDFYSQTHSTVATQQSFDIFLTSF